MYRNLLIVSFALAGLPACAVNEVIVAEETELSVAPDGRNDGTILDVGIVRFEDGVPANNDPTESLIHEDIRHAEVRYLAYHLKTTMERTGHWGAVRVVPSRAAFTDIVISGEIEKSDGEYVELDISVHDSRGNHWYDKTYTTQTGIMSYSETRDRRQDPYQKVFNDIANDLSEFVELLPAGSVDEIQQVSELKFFADMSPQAYGEHLAEDKDGVHSVVRLPAENDPAVVRLRQIRERDRLVVDTLNEHYANFYYGIAIPYQSWRKTSREESINYRKVKRSATMQSLLGVVVIAGALAVDTGGSSNSKTRMNRSLQNIAIGQGIETLMAGISRGSEAKIHIESIKELSESFGAEAAPMVVSVEGETRRLTGTAAAQYESWRKLLKEIYEADTGFAVDGHSSDPDPVRTAEPAG